MTKRRRSDRCSRSSLCSPGRPGVARQDDRRRFWDLIRLGRSSEDAALAVGVSGPVGFRWFRAAGGLPPSQFSRSAARPSGRYLSFAEREEIALMLAQGCALRAIARHLKRSPSTISREIRRNAATRSGGFDYRATSKPSLFNCRQSLRAP